MEGISKLIFGTVQLGIDYGINNNSGKPSFQDALQLLQSASESGMKIIDTADGYGDAIKIIAAYHENNAPFEVITKFSALPYINIQIYVQQVLERLHVDHIYGLMYHKYADFIKYPHLTDLLTIEKEKGNINHIGVSVYTNEELKDCIEHDSIDIIQLPYNLLDNYSQRGHLLKKAKAKNKIIHTRSVFLQGLFFKPVDSLPEKLVPLKTYLKQLKEIEQTSNCSMHELALNYAVHTGEVDNVLFGAEKIMQLQMNIDGIKKEFSEDVFELVNTIAVKEKELLNPANW